MMLWKLKIKINSVRMQRRLLPYFATKNSKSVQVFLASDEDSIAGMIAAINSIIMNTIYPVHFYLVTNEFKTRHLTYE
uniref:Uncharacterized protein n=1 Tax=Strigamia maritima TaxID=126957 RepID=T1JN39_STRMM